MVDGVIVPKDSAKTAELFFRSYRRMWFVLVVLTFLTLPLYTLAFFSLINWLSPVAGLMAFLGTFVLHLTLFVAGRWSAKDGFTGLEVKKRQSNS